MLEQTDTGFLSLPEVKITKVFLSQKSIVLLMEKQSKQEVCPKCACLSSSVYDRRRTLIQDEPLGPQRRVTLDIHKRRFWCDLCQKPFTEPIAGIKKGHRTTERFKKVILWACENLTSLKKVQETYQVSAGYVFKVFYQQLELKRRMHQQYSWPKTIGVDEHSFRRREGTVEFVSFIIDYVNKRGFEVVDGRTEESLVESLKSIPGRDQVENVTMDMCEAFRNFSKNLFPQAKIVVDKFHVIRLLNKSLTARRIEVLGDQRKNPIRKLLFKVEDKLAPWKRRELRSWLNQPQHHAIREVYDFKQALHRLYRIKGEARAEKALLKLIQRASESKIKPIKTLSETLSKWKQEILNYFPTRLTNARTEGFNNLAKVVQRRAFGYKNFENYRLRLLYACH